jgi:FixJ family two-component response regulator
VSLLPNQTVFVIDDDPVFRHLIVLVFKKFGLKGEVFSDAETFFAAAEKKVPAMFVVDLNMGTTNSGLEIVKTLRERFP